MTQKSLDRFAENVVWGNWENYVNGLTFVLRFYVKWVDYDSENLASLKYRLSAGKQRKLPGQRWVPKLVIIM